MIVEELSHNVRRAEIALTPELKRVACFAFSKFAMKASVFAYMVFVSLSLSSIF